jgi:hypothetical protein
MRGFVVPTVLISKTYVLPEADPDDVRELLNYKKTFEFVSEYIEDGRRRIAEEALADLFGIEMPPVLPRCRKRRSRRSAKRASSSGWTRTLAPEKAAGRL